MSDDIENYDICVECGNSTDWRECPNCDEGFVDHDCGEDTCCCLEPYLNVPCDTCGGDSGWYGCLTCDSNKEAKASGVETLSAPPIPKGTGIRAGDLL